MMLDALISRLRSGDMTLDEFATAAAGAYLDVEGPDYPSTDSSGAAYAVSAASLAEAVSAGDITEDEMQAVFDALPAD